MPGDDKVIEDTDGDNRAPVALVIEKSEEEVAAPSRCKRALLFGAKPLYATRCMHDNGHGGLHRGRRLTSGEESSNCDYIVWQDPGGFDSEKDIEYAWIYEEGEVAR